jgi:hypothetical protein
MAKSLFENEFATSLRQIKEFEFRVDRLREQIAYKRSTPNASMAEVEEAIAASERAREEAMDAFTAQLENSRRQWQHANILILLPEEYSQAKALWRELVRQVHPDLLDGPSDDPILGRALQELYEMKETGYDPAKLAEIDARLRAYKASGQPLDEPEGADTGATTKRLEQTAASLRERARQLREELRLAELDPYFRYRHFITDPAQREQYASQLDHQLQEVLKAFDAANREFLSLFDNPK